MVEQPAGQELTYVDAAEVGTRQENLYMLISCKTKKAPHYPQGFHFELVTCGSLEGACKSCGYPKTRQNRSKLSPTHLPHLPTHCHARSPSLVCHGQSHLLQSPAHT